MGLGQSHQKLYYLPAERTDFIFSIIGEELGFAGACLVILLFMAMVVQGIRVAQKSRDIEGFLLAFGITFAIALQAVLNVAVVTGSVPPKGMSLPFISFGGSGLFFLMISIGVLTNIARAGTADDAVETERLSHGEDCDEEY